MRLPRCPTCDRAVLLGWPSGCGCDAGATFFRVHQSAKLGGSNKSNSCPEIAVLAKLASRPDTPSHLFYPRQSSPLSTLAIDIFSFSCSFFLQLAHAISSQCSAAARSLRSPELPRYEFNSPYFFLAYRDKLPQLPHYADHQPQLQASPIVRLPGATQQRRALSIHEYLSADLLRKVKKT